MAKRSPMLGYATKTEAALALRDQGLSNQQIAEKFGTQYTEDDIATIMRWTKRRKKSSRGAGVSADTFQALRPHATKRGLSVRELIARLIDQIASDNLVDAILDDRIVQEAA